MLFTYVGHEEDLHKLHHELRTPTVHLPLPADPLAVVGGVVAEHDAAGGVEVG